MNRRSFLGASAGATIAGPDVVSKMAAQQFAQPPSSLLGSVNVAGSHLLGGRLMEPDDAIRKAFSLGIISREKIAELLAQSGLTDRVTEFNLDPDLRGAKSFSLSARIRMQQARNAAFVVDRFLSKPKSLWDFGRDLLANGIIKGGET